MFDIDFVVLWVDNSDIEWQKQFNKYLPQDRNRLDIGSNKYRDNGFLKYWFRGIERNAPWVRKIHFVTMGQIPSWLNISNPKIHLVNHSDFIDKKYLPLFNSSAIELNIHKIPGLSEHFVYFNDDFFLINCVSPRDYFTDTGIPKDSAILRSIPISEYGKLLLNNENLINKKLNRKKCFLKYLRNFFSIKYGKRLIGNMFYKNKIDDAYLECCHYSRPLTKTAFENGWKFFEKELLTTMENRYRTNSDYTFCLFRVLNIYNGNISPVNNEKYKMLCDINKNIEKICKTIEKQKVREIVINDSICSDYEYRVKKIIDSFNYIFPKKSNFEV